MTPQRRRLALAPLLLLLGISGAAQAQQEPLPPPFTAKYTLYYSGEKFINKKIAVLTRRLTGLGDDRYEYHSEIKTTGLLSLIRKVRIVESSRLTFEDGVLRPHRYNYERTDNRKRREVAVAFDWDGGKITNTISGDAWDLPTEPPVMDKLLYQLAIMHDLKKGQPPASYLVADGKKVKTYDIERLGEERIDTPFGNYHTVKMLRRRPGSDRKSVFWCAPDLEYLPVKVEHDEKDGSKTRAVLKSLHGIEPRPTAVTAR